MKKQLQWVLCLMIIGVVSCKKNTEDVVIPKLNCLLVNTLQTNEDSSVSKYNYLYDSQNRRIQDTYTNPLNSRFNSITKYEYGNKSIKSSYVDGEGYTQKFEYILDNNGYAVSYKITGGYGSVTNVFLKYDDNGYLIERTSGDKNYSVKFGYTNGNNTDISTFYNGVQTDLTKISFDTNLIDNNKGISNELLKPDLFGKPNKNLIKQIQYYDQTGKLIVNTLFSYSLDSQGNIIQKIDKNSNGIIHAQNDYSYQCQ